MNDITITLHKIIVNSSDPLELLPFIQHKLPSVKKLQTKQWLKFQQILVNGEVQTKYDYSLLIGDIVKIIPANSSPFSEKNSKIISNGNINLKIIYDDKEMIVIDKPCGIPSTAKSEYNDDKVENINKANNKQKSVYEIILSKLQTKSSSKYRLYPINKLDTQLSGILIFAKNLETKNSLMKSWKSCGITFTVICNGLLTPKQGVLHHYYKFSNSSIVLFNNNSYSTNRNNITNMMISNYRTLNIMKDIHSNQSYSMLEISLQTNIKDQISNQLAFLGNSIVGDSVSLMSNKISNNPLRRNGMHLSEIRMIDELTGNNLIFNSPIPTSFTEFFNKMNRLNGNEVLTIESAFSSKVNNEEIILTDDDDENEEFNNGIITKSKTSKVKLISVDEYLSADRKDKIQIKNNKK
eukprot:gene14392-19317_t